MRTKKAVFLLYFSFSIFFEKNYLQLSCIFVILHETEMSYIEYLWE